MTTMSNKTSSSAVSASASSSLPPLQFTGAAHLTSRLVLSTLTGRALRISSIRSTSSAHPGLHPHEVSFLRLLEALTNGSHIEFSYTGTTLLYRPGLIVGSGTGSSAINGVIRHNLPIDNARGLSWFLVPICLLAPFAKHPVNILFTGPGVITSATQDDISVDTVRTALLPLYRLFGIERNLELRILRRSHPGPNGRGGAGEVSLLFGHQVRLPRTLHLLNRGRIKSLRGVASATGVAAATNIRLITAARAILNPLCGDVYIFSDVSKAPFLPGSKRPTGIGFGLSLVAESTTGTWYSADLATLPEGGITPEDLGRACAFRLLETIAEGGCVSRVAAPTVLVLMAMGSEDVGRLQLGRAVLDDPNLVNLARDCRAFGLSAWGLRDATSSSTATADEEDEEENDEMGDAGEGEIIVSVVGKGVGNVGRKIA